MGSRMRIACPGCAAEYDVPDALLAAGPRPLRCKRCGTEFRAELPPAAPFAPPSAPAPAPALPLAAPPGATPPAPEPAARAAAPPAAADDGILTYGPGEPAEPPPEPPRPLSFRGTRRHAPIDPPLPRREERVPDGRGAAIAGWIGSVILLLTAAWLAYAWRSEITAFWPPAARLYAALGLG
jgi:predicted Zn finger-like uncharacterized protein